MGGWGSLVITDESSLVCVAEEAGVESHSCTGLQSHRSSVQVTCLITSLWSVWGACEGRVSGSASGPLSLAVWSTLADGWPSRCCSTGGSGPEVFNQTFGSLMSFTVWPAGPQWAWSLGGGGGVSVTVELSSFDQMFFSWTTDCWVESSLLCRIKRGKNGPDHGSERWLEGGFLDTKSWTPPGLLRPPVSFVLFRPIRRRVFQGSSFLLESR